MKSIIKQLIIDFQATELPIFLPRNLKLPTLPPSLRKAWVITGMRRCGKTWFLYQIIDSLIKQGIPKENILYLNFEDDRFMPCKNDLQSILDAYFELYPNNTKSTNLHFFFDEVHEAPDWEHFIRRLLDSESMQLYLTGSSSKLLSKEIATSLRGRTLVRELFPFSFTEYLNQKKIPYPKNPSTKQISILQNALGHFLKYGGFPETLEASNSLHRELLQGYLDTVIYRDIIDRYKITNTEPLRILFTQCLRNVGGFLSVHKMYTSLKSQGIAISKNTLYEYMNHFQDAYCLFSVPLYHFSYSKQTINPKKIYPIDQGFIHACTIKPNFEQSASLETTVFSSLRRTTEKIYYYHSADGSETDFLTLESDKIYLYQACLSLNDEKTRNREIKGLKQAMAETKTKEAFLITIDEEEFIEIPEGIIQVLPLWKFLLQNENKPEESAINQ